jgi:hypothetical protein
VDNRNLLVGLWQTAVGLAFVGLGFLGVFRSLSPAPPAPRALPTEADRGGLEPYAERRIALLRAGLCRTPGDPDLHLRLARAYTARAMVMVHQEYSDAFPNSFQDGKLPVDHYETWRRGWCFRDRCGDLRQALHHARLTLTAHPTKQTRLGALRLIAYVLRQRNQEAASVPVLREAVRLDPHDLLAWNLLAEACQVAGDTAGCRDARRHVAALDQPLRALPVYPSGSQPAHYPQPQAARAPAGRAAVPAAG